MFSEIISKTGFVRKWYEVLKIGTESIVNPTYFAIFELEYISKKQYEEHGDTIVQEKLKEAKEQLAKYQTSDELINMNNLKKFAIVFVYDKCMINEEAM